MSRCTLFILCQHFVFILYAGRVYNISQLSMKIDMLIMSQCTRSMKHLRGLVAGELTFDLGTFIFDNQFATCTMKTKKNTYRRERC